MNILTTSEGLNTLYNNIVAPIYISRAQLRHLKLDKKQKYETKMTYIEALSIFEIGDLKITPIPLSHDAS